MRRHSSSRAVEHVEACIRRDPIQPRPQRRPPLEPAKTLPRAQERLLHRVFGIVEQPQYPLAMHPELAPVAFDESRERRLVTRPRCDDNRIGLDSRLVYLGPSHHTFFITRPSAHS
jgi:hypothetical protein